MLRGRVQWRIATITREQRPGPVDLRLSGTTAKLLTAWSPGQVANAQMASTSANRTGEPGMISAEAVRSAFGVGLELVVDAGEISGGVASTVLDLSGNTPVLLRHGAVPLEDIEDALGAHLTKATGPVG